MVRWLEQLIPMSPAAHVRRSRVDYESHATGLDRNELGVFLVRAGLAGARDHGLACLLALNGLRISEPLNADIEQLESERGHRTLAITRKGGKRPPTDVRRSMALSSDCGSVGASVGIVMRCVGG